MNVDVSFITINYNGLADTLEFIASVKQKVSSVNYEIIVVDNASKEDEATEISNQHPDVKVVRSNKNLGFAGGNNLALPKATGKYLCFINNDTIIQVDGFAQIIQRFENHPSIGMISAKLRYWAESSTLQYAGFTPLSRITLRNEGIGCGEQDKGQYDTALPTAYPHGACMLIPSKVLNEVGPMYEDYFLYYEELDWAERIRRAGYEIYYDPSSVILHKESRTTGDGSPLKAYYLTRNRLLFARRNRGLFSRMLCYLYLMAVVFIRGFKVSKEHRTMMRKGVIDFLAKRYGPFNDEK